MVRQCCECQRIYHEGEWIEVGGRRFKLGEVTHGYCDACLEELKRSILQYQALGLPPIAAAAA